MVFISLISSLSHKASTGSVEEQQLSVKHYVIQYKIKWPTVDIGQTLVIIIARVNKP